MYLLCVTGMIRVTSMRRVQGRPSELSMQGYIVCRLRQGLFRTLCEMTLEVDVTLLDNPDAGMNGTRYQGNYWS